MGFLSICLLSLAMSADAFAAAVVKGAGLERPSWREALRTGLIFGAIEGATPVLGWALGTAASRLITDWDHWIAFVLLGTLGVLMIRSGLQSKPSVTLGKPQRHSFWLLAVTGLATSIDAMAVGVGLAFINVSIWPVAAAIGCTTAVMVTLGVMLGRVLGMLAGQRAEIVGGVLLIGIGTGILVEHLALAQ